MRQVIDFQGYTRIETDLVDEDVPIAFNIVVAEEYTDHLTTEAAKSICWAIAKQRAEQLHAEAKARLETLGDPGDN